MKSRKILREGLVFATVYLMTIIGFATEVSEHDYARAEQFLPWNVAKFIGSMRVEPHWVEGGDWFWYCMENQSGKKF